MKHSLLIVDDEKVICNGLSRVFEDSYKTYTACSGIEALDIIKSNDEITIMLCDLMMPEMKGMELIDRIRNVNKSMYIIVISAASDIAVYDAMKNGANYYMRKPLDINQLENMVHDAISYEKVKGMMNN